MVPVLGNADSRPVNKDAAKLIKKLPRESYDEESIRWAGLISKCPKCGDRGYENGYCFGCGRPIAIGSGLRMQKKKLRSDDEDFT